MAGILLALLLFPDRISRKAPVERPNAKKKWLVRQATNQWERRKKGSAGIMHSKKKERKSLWTHHIRKSRNLHPLKSYTYICKTNSSRLTALAWFTWFGRWPPNDLRDLRDLRARPTVRCSVTDQRSVKNGTDHQPNSDLTVPYRYSKHRIQRHSPSLLDAPW